MVFKDNMKFLGKIVSKEVKYRKLEAFGRFEEHAGVPVVLLSVHPNISCIYKRLYNLSSN